MRQHHELHFSKRIGWLRAAVLGANDGIVSTASLVVGVASANIPQTEVLLAGVAGLVAGAMSMAAGEYVSVSSQADTENADLARERYELEQFNESEHRELANIYIKRGLTPSLAQQVADQLMEHDALQAHARDELGITELHIARPLQAAMASLITFSLGAALPLLIATFSPLVGFILFVASGSLLCLILLGGLAAYAGGADIKTGAIRVGLWGMLAMLTTALVGKLFGSVMV